MYTLKHDSSLNSINWCEIFHASNTESATRNILSSINISSIPNSPRKCGCSIETWWSVLLLFETLGQLCSNDNLCISFCASNNCSFIFKICKIYIWEFEFWWFHQIQNMKFSQVACLTSFHLIWVSNDFQELAHFKRYHTYYLLTIDLTYMYG